MHTTPVMPVRPRAALTALALVAGGACSGDPVSPLTPADVTGSYVLASIDGATPPIPFIGTSTIIADTTTYRADGTWQQVEVNGVRGGGMTPTRVARYGGVWRLDAGRRILLNQQTGSGGPFPEHELEVREQGRALVFRQPSGPMSGSVWRYKRVP